MFSRSTKFDVKKIFCNDVQELNLNTCFSNSLQFFNVIYVCAIINIKLKQFVQLCF